MFIGRGDGITLHKMTKYDDIKRQKKPSHSVPSWGVFYVVIEGIIQAEEGTLYFLFSPLSASPLVQKFSPLSASPLVFYDNPVRYR